MRPPVVKGNMLVILEVQHVQRWVLAQFTEQFFSTWIGTCFLFWLWTQTLDCNYEVKALIFSFEGVLCLINVELVALL